MTTTTTTTPLIDQLFAYVSEAHPRSLRGLQEARGLAPARFDEIVELHLRWLVSANGEKALEPAVDAFVEFNTGVNLAQARYERDGKYPNQSFDEVYHDQYSDDQAMDVYLWGAYLTNFLWAHHLGLMMFFQDRFISRLGDRARLIDIAPGHGGWGVWTLWHKPRMTLHGYDISAQSVRIATRLAEAAGVSDRAVFIEKNALDLSEIEAGSADACVCNFLVEHLEDPQHLYNVVAHLLKTHGLAFITGGLTSPHTDHIYEYRYESELVKMCENAGLRVLETLSANPLRTLPKARFLPRSMSLLVQKRKNEIY